MLELTKQKAGDVWVAFERKLLFQQVAVALGFVYWWFFKHVKQ